MKLLIRMPTYGRPEKVLAVLPKYYAFLSNQVEFEFIVSCNCSDETMNSAGIRAALAAFPHLSVHYADFSGKIDAYNGHMDVCADWDVAMVTSDDMLPVEQGFDRIIVEQMQQSYPDTDGVLHFDDGYKGESLNTLPILGRRYFERFNYVYHPTYKSFYGDDEFGHVARTLGRLSFIDRVIIRHEHPCNIGAEKDELYREQDRYFLMDRANYEQRRANGFGLGQSLMETVKASITAGPGDQAVRLSACMIVRDSSRTLPACLESIRPWVDEIVAVDTGSMDSTPQIAERFGARVFHFPWCDDFSAARNESIRHARGRWVFWMDSDDTISAENGQRLRALADEPLETSPMAYVIQVHCPSAHSDLVDVTVVDHVKMFRNSPQLRFEGRIHEQVLPSIRRLNGRIAWSDVFVVHSGADHSPKGRGQKQQRDLHLLELELADRPNHPFALFNLGMTYNDMGEHEEAVSALRQCLTVSNPGESHVRKAHALLAASLGELQRFDEAESVCQVGLQHYPKDAELLFRQGILAHRAGQLAAAVSAYCGALLNDEPRHFTSIDRGVVGFKARHNLALVYMDMGKPEMAELQWRLAIEEAPAFAAARHALTEALVRQRKLCTADVEGDRLLGSPVLRGEGYFIKATVASATGNIESAQEFFAAALEAAPDNLAFLRGSCQFLFEHGKPSEAEVMLRRLTEREPKDASAHHNLGTIYVRLGRDREAERSYRESLRLRPDCVPTLLQLAHVLQRLGQFDQALRFWQRAAQIEPDNPAVSTARPQTTSGLTRG